MSAATAIRRALGRLLRFARAGERRLAWNDPRVASPATLMVTSSAFADGAPMPRRSAGARVGGGGLSPPLAWSGAPAGTRAYALIVEDPDAPTPRPIVHALAFDIPADRGALAEGALAAGADPAIAFGRGAFGRIGYAGPAPIAGHGPHAYVFELFALSRPLGLDARAGKSEALAAMAGAVLARGRLTGFYERQ